MQFKNHNLAYETISSRHKTTICGNPFLLLNSYIAVVPKNRMWLPKMVIRLSNKAIFISTFSHPDINVVKAIFLKVDVEISNNPKICRFMPTSPLSQDLWKRELSTQTPRSIQKVLGTCPQHNTIKFEVRQIPSSEIGKNLHVF